MMFLWFKEPAPSPKAGPWLAWLVTAVIFWRFRRRIVRTVLAVSPLRLLKARRYSPVPSTRHTLLPSSLNSSTTVPATGVSAAAASADVCNNKSSKYCCQVSRAKRNTHGRTRVKGLSNCDGPHVTISACSLNSQHLNCRVTRSGRVYGKYPSKKC